MTAYFISGLAADNRIFGHIRLPDGFEPIYLDWIEPLKNESLRSYAIRMAEKIDLSQPLILIGLSMGGMIACEIANQYPAAGIILVSSIPVSTQLPRRYRIGQKLGIHRILPIGLLKSGAIVKRFFTAEHVEDKIMLKKVIRDSDPRFIRWAMKAILEWKNDLVPSPIWQFHGTKDEILPVRITNPTKTVQGGTHMMVLTNSEELNILIQEALTEIIDKQI